MQSYCEQSELRRSARTARRRHRAGRIRDRGRLHSHPVGAGARDWRDVRARWPRRRRARGRTPAHPQGALP